LNATNRGPTESFATEILNFGRFGALHGCYNPSDVEEAQDEFGANCGPASFGAICRTPVVDSMRFFPHFPKRDWTTIGDMKKALRTAETQFVKAGPELPEFGLVLLQLRTNNRPAHPLYSLSQTHWVGVFQGCFYDVNWQGWLPIPIWEELVLSQLEFGTKPVIGWAVRNALAVVEVKYRRAVLWEERTKATHQAVSDGSARPFAWRSSETETLTAPMV
jgi:hypothetical protein